jgi:hypothetical protein
MEDYNNAAFLARDGAVAYNDAKGTSCANLAEVRARRSTEYRTHRLPPLCVRDEESCRKPLRRSFKRSARLVRRT